MVKGTKKPGEESNSRAGKGGSAGREPEKRKGGKGKFTLPSKKNQKGIPLLGGIASHKEPELVKGDQKKREKRNKRGAKKTEKEKGPRAWGPVSRAPISTGEPKAIFS